MKTALFAAAAAMIAAASPATAASDGVKMNYDAKSGKYCYKGNLTDSRIPKTICQTRAELEADGVTLLAPKKTEVAANTTPAG